eukprot:CAMPEP_0119387904 /NCGR_PEP_ID=MMETSP1334-20130426/102655_1 /TAXON_ID=127549 /ORGANISM="Calcidiscus leptoporus, Strain RCC1130" /LENGTH=37 /DNA_ID= /DNA_START= /DNA_END= /DNA_ORIENTATION=
MGVYGILLILGLFLRPEPWLTRSHRSRKAAHALLLLF